MCGDSPEIKEPAEFPLWLHEPGVPGTYMVEAGALPSTDLSLQLQFLCYCRLLV